MPWFQNDCEEVSKFVLGREYVPYIKQQLEGWWDFSKLLLQNTDWESGLPMAFLPTKHPAELVTSPDWSWKGRGVRKEFYNYLADLLDAGPNQVLVMEDSMWSPGDKHFESVGTKLLCNGHLYQYCTIPTAEAVKDTIHSTKSACLSNGALCTFSRVNLPADGEEVGARLLDDLSRNCSIIIVNGFDDCGYVMWEKQPIGETGEGIRRPS